MRYGEAVDAAVLRSSRARWWIAAVALPVLALAACALLISRTRFDRALLALCYEPASASYPLAHSWFFQGALVWGAGALIAGGALVLAFGVWRAPASMRERCAYLLACLLGTTAIAAAWSAVAPMRAVALSADLPQLRAARTGPGLLPAAGFAWVALVFAAPSLRRLPRAAWLAPGLLLGTLLACTQVVRGQAPLSQQLHALAIAWLVAAALAARFEARAWSRAHGAAQRVASGAPSLGSPAPGSARTDFALPWLAGVSAGLAGVAFFFVDLLLDRIGARYEDFEWWFEGFEFVVMGLGIGIGAYFLAEHVRDTRVRAGRRLAEEREERFRVLGRMAAAVAHEVRNPLHTLRLILDEQRLELPALAHHPLRREVDASLARINAAVDLVYRLARPQREEDARADLARATREALAALERSGAEAARFVWSSSEERAVVRGSHVGLGIVIDNLLRNAAAAAPSGSVIALELARRGREWALEIRNPGALQPRAAGEASARGASLEGLGLGLAISRQIAASAGGRIELEEAEGVVTCTLSWPAQLGEEA